VFSTNIKLVACEVTPLASPLQSLIKLKAGSSISELEGGMTETEKQTHSLARAQLQFLACLVFPPLMVNLAEGRCSLLIANYRRLFAFCVNRHFRNCLPNVCPEPPALIQFGDFRRVSLERLFLLLAALS